MINKRQAKREIFTAVLQALRKYIAARPTALPDAFVRQSPLHWTVIEVQSGDTFFDITIKERTP